MVKEKMTEKKEEKNEAQLVEVPTQTSIAFKLEDGKVVPDAEMLCRIYNKLLKIEKAVC